MFKLLPEQTKAKVRKEYILRRFSVMLALLSSLLVFTSVAMLPPLIFANEKREAALFTLSAVEKTKTILNKDALEAWVIKTKQDLTFLVPDPVSDQPYGYFLKILTVKPADVIINGLSWAKSTGPLSLRVRGVAKDRQTLLSFQSKLVDSDEWAQVDLPVGTIAQEANISFDISLTPKKTQ